MPIVELSEVSLTIGGVPILVGVNLVVDEGERVGIAGANGAGKSTLLSVLTTLVAPTSGEGTVMGKRLGLPEVTKIRKRIGWSGHEPALYPDLTLAENLAHVARLAGLDRRTAEKALTQVGLQAAMNRRVAVCSNGMRRRADLARLLMTSPDLVLLDEADAGLDADATAIVSEISRRTIARNGAVVTVSHDAELLKERTDRVLVIAGGSIV